MDDTTIPPQTPTGDTFGRISSWRDFEDRFKAAMAVAAAHPVDLTLVDTDFSRWPLGQRSVIEAFHQWSVASRGAQCRLVAAHYDGFGRHHPRWMSWRTTWSHRVQCYQVPEDLASSLMPMLVLRGTIGLRVNEPLRGGGIWTREQGRLTEWLTEIDVISQRSESALPPTLLGL